VVSFVSVLCHHGNKHIINLANSYIIYDQCKNNDLILLLFEPSQANHEHYTHRTKYTDVIKENSTFMCNNKPGYTAIKTARVSAPAYYFKQTNVCKSFLPLAKPAICILICTGSLGLGKLSELMFPFCELSMLSRSGVSR
jgi:hypothetical protein